MIVGIIGAGTMGSGIAQAFAQCEGFQVRLCDITEEFAARGKGRIENQLTKRVQKGKMDAAAAEAVLNRIVTGTKDICSDCDLIVEAAFESMDVKKQTFEELQAIAKPTCIFASNTSSLSITEIGAKLDRPLVGMHFFNPAPVMKLVEVIAGINTPRELVDQVKAIAVSLGTTPVEVNEAAGFVVNRILIPMINEAVGVYAEGVASAEDIDTERGYILYSWIHELDSFTVMTREETYNNWRSVLEEVLRENLQILDHPHVIGLGYARQCLRDQLDLIAETLGLTKRDYRRDMSVGEPEPEGSDE